MEFKEEDFLPVILGGDITAYSLARTFHEEYQVKSLVVSQISSHMCADSSILENIIVPGMENLDVFLPALARIAEEHPGKKLILMACGDWYVRLIVENRAELEKHYILPYIQEDLLNRLVLKDSFYAICDEVGVPYPRTAYYHVDEEPSALEVPFNFPVVAKPASSAAYHYAQFPGKKKVFFLKTREELEEVLSNLRTSSYQDAFLIQEFIPGDDTAMRILTTYSDRTGKVRFASFGQTLLEDKRPMAVGNPVAIVNRVDDEIVAEATRLLESVGYTGFANFDIKTDARDGSHRFFEINTRLGRSNFYVTSSGFNTVRWIVDDLVRERTFDDEIVVADNTDSLYTVVPKSVILDYVTDPALRAEVERLFAEGKAHDPLDYAAEKKFLRRLYPRIFARKQRKAFTEAFATNQAAESLA